MALAGATITVFIIAEAEVNRFRDSLLHGDDILKKWLVDEFAKWKRDMASRAFEMEDD